MASLFKVKISTLMNNAFGVSTDEDGIDSSVRIAAFNIGYQLFLNEWQKTDMDFFLRTLNFVSSDAGTSLEDLGTDQAGNPITNFYRPYQIIPYDDSVSPTVYDIEPLPETRSAFIDNTRKRWYIERQTDGTRKIFFLGYEAGQKFKVQYIPQFEIFDFSQAESTEVDFHPKALPQFSQFLTAMYESIEDEPNTTAQAPHLLFQQYMKGFFDSMNDEAPGQFNWN